MSKLLSYAVSASSVLSILLLFGYVAQATSASTLFFWHPVPLAFGFLLLMTQSSLLLTSEHSLLGILVGSASRKVKVQIHFWLQLAAAFVITVGFSAIFINKINGGKPHLTSWHSWAGLVSCILSWFQIILGMWMYMSRFRDIISWIVTLPPEITVKKVHRLVGALTFAVLPLALLFLMYFILMSIFVVENRRYIVAAVTFFLAVTTGYAEKNFPSGINATISINVAVMTIAVVPLTIRMKLPAWLM